MAIFVVVQNSGVFNYSLGNSNAFLSCALKLRPFQPCWVWSAASSKTVCRKLKEILSVPCVCVALIKSQSSGANYFLFKSYYCIFRRFFRKLASGDPQGPKSDQKGFDQRHCSICLLQWFESTIKLWSKEAKKLKKINQKKEKSRSKEAVFSQNLTKRKLFAYERKAVQFGQKWKKVPRNNTSRGKSIWTLT